MHTRSSSRRSAAVALATVLGGCTSSMHSQYSEPYALFVAEHRMAMHDIQPALILAIDGKSVPAGGKDPVNPGSRVVEVRVSGLAAGNTKTITVDAQPCTRYYLGAKHTPSAADWTVMVTASEPIGECKKAPAK